MHNITICKHSSVVPPYRLVEEVEHQLAGAKVRAVLISNGDKGKFAVEQIRYGESVLNIGRDLVSHLNEYPHTDKWLCGIKAAIEHRLASRRVARQAAALSLPDPQTRKWS